MFSAEGETPLARFADRRDAGRQLAAQLLSLADKHPVVVGLPRGGIPVASEIAIALKAPLEILAVRKLGAPHNPEYGIGAIVEDGTRIFDPEALAALDIDGAMLEAIVARASAELCRRVVAYRAGRPPMPLRNRTVVVVDDGVATGVTDTAAIRAIRRLRPRRLILAVPVCAPDSLARLRREADEMICLIAPPRLRGVGEWYRDFSQIHDQEVITALGAARRSLA
ncbi:MAG TPA: phosphoribosyltransferase family protein [Solirubrobacterales bacterium]|nr:phosphoribosyltransferase family protein [Solirubrobacterales bacterium]